MKTENLFAKIVSYLFHPLLLPTIGLYIIFHLDGSGLWSPSQEAQLYLFGFTFIATFLLPVMNVIFLLKMKIISSLEVETRQERKIPYLAAAIFYFTESYFLMNADIPVLVKALMFGATLLVVSVLLINLFWKISAHMVGIGGLCGMILFFSWRLQVNVLPLLMILFFISGLIGYARIKLSSHTPAQV